MREVGVHGDADDLALALAEFIEPAIEGQPTVSI
jgi:hypothetical protein